MHEHSSLIEQIDDDRVFGRQGRHLHDRIPSGFHRHHRARRHRGSGRDQRVVVLAHTVLNLRAHGGAGCQQIRRRYLYGRRHRQIGVADRLESIECIGDQRCTAADGNPAKLHLRQADRLRKPAQRKRQRVRLPKRTARRIAGNAVID